MNLIHLKGNLYQLSRYDSLQHEANALYIRGCDAANAGDVATAQTYLAQAVHADASHKQAWLNLGLIQLQKGDLKRAEFCFRQALAADPGYAMARYNLASVLQDQKKYRQAKQEYEKVLADSPEDFDAMFNLAHLHYFGLSDAETSWRMALRCEKLQPNDPNLRALKRSLTRHHRDHGWQLTAS